MKNIIILLLFIVGLTSCKKNEPIETPINPLIGNWRGPLAMGPNLIEFTNDTFYEYIDSLDLIFVSSYKLDKQTILVKGHYTLNWNINKPHDTSYSVQFVIRADSLFFNDIYKGKKF